MVLLPLQIREEGAGVEEESGRKDEVPPPVVWLVKLFWALTMASGGREGGGGQVSVYRERKSFVACHTRREEGREGGVAGRREGGRTQLIGQLVGQVRHLGEGGPRVPDGAEGLRDALLAAGHNCLDFRLGQVHVLLHDLVQVVFAGLREGGREGLEKCLGQV